MREKMNLFVTAFLIFAGVRLATADDTTPVASISTTAPDGTVITDNSGVNQLSVSDQK